MAVVRFDNESDSQGVVLVEAKSNLSEVYGNGCQASAKSRKQIEAALGRTKRWLDVPELLDWTGPLYQMANRLAHLYFFREIVRVPAWLVNVYFVDDPHSPTALEDWRLALSDVKTELGLTPAASPYTGDVFPEAKERWELTGHDD